MKKHLDRLALWLTLTAAALVMYGRYAAGQLPVGADTTLMYAPFYSLHWHGGPPLWNPCSLSGTALDDNLQAALLYPLRWPFYFIHDWRDYFGLFTTLHYLVAALGMGVFLRALGLRRGAALAGAILFACGGHLAGRVLNPTIFQACCWLPWLLLGAADCRRRHAWATTLGLAMILWIGSPHLMFYGLLGYGIALACLVLVPLWRAGRYREGALIVCSRAVHLLLALLLAAPTLLPGILRAQESIRTQTSIAANLADSAAWSEVPLMLFGGTGAAIFPEYIDRCCFVGALALALVAALALRKRSWRDGRCWCGLLLTLAGLIFALGHNTGVQFLMPWIPGFRNLAGASRALILSAAGLALLAALALDGLCARPMKRMGLAFLFAGLVCLGVFIARSWALAPGRGQGPFTGQWFQAWLAAPSCIGRELFGWVDSGVALLAAGAVVLLCGGRDRLRLGLLAGLLWLQLWHFSPRVNPPTERMRLANAPAATLQALQAASREPFRIVGYDPQRLHDGEFNRFKLDTLMPNLATLYGLEDIQGFDPLIHLRYAALFGDNRAPFNDPIHNLDIARPDPALFDLLGVRYLIGNPFDRRLTTIPQTLFPAAPLAPVEAWAAAPAPGPITRWNFISLLDHALNVPKEEEVARLIVEAAEGRFEFPVRNGIESADIHALNYPRRAPPTGLVNMEWTTHVPVAELGYTLREANYRGSIDFGRPLTVKRLTWQLLRPDIIFNVAGQSYRLAEPAPQSNPWSLVTPAGGGGVSPTPEGQLTPIYEYRLAKPRATLVPYSLGGSTKGKVTLDTRTLNAPSLGRVEWLARDNNGMRLSVQSPTVALLVLREIWTPEWRARVNGKEQSVAAVNGILRGIEVPAGASQVTLVYRPMLFYRLLALAVAALAAMLVFYGLKKESPTQEIPEGDPCE